MGSGALCTSQYEATLFHVATLVAFFRAFQVSELVASSKKNSSGTVMKLTHLSLAHNKTYIVVWQSKTDQCQRGTLVEFGSWFDPELCPVRVLNESLKHRERGPGMVFQQSDGSPLMKHQSWAVTSHTLAKTGLAGQRFRTHLFHISAALTAAVMGYPVSGTRRVFR